MKLLIVGEGKHEKGGALETLVCRVLGTAHECSFDWLRATDIHSHHGKGKGYLKKAIRWMLEAKERGYDALILLVDYDGFSERLTEIRDAQEHLSVCRLPRAFGVAIRSFDAWMLADEIALSDVIGVTIQRQADPETTDNPKTVCSELLNRMAAPLAQSELYSKLAQLLDIDILAKRCPDGFGEFKRRLEKMRADIPKLP